MVRKFNGQAPEIHETAYVAPSAQVIGRVTLGENASVWDNAVLRGDEDAIVVGRNSNVQDLSVLHNAAGIPLVIGENVTVGHHVVLHSCTIGDNTLIGMGAIILDGARIGRNCLIGAGALVTPNTEIPDGSLVLGSPAKVVRPLGEDRIAATTANAAEYVRLARIYLDEAECDAAQTRK